MANRSDNRGSFAMGLRPTMRPAKYSKAEMEYDRLASQAMREVERHMGFIFTMVLYDKFDWGLRKISNCQEKITSIKKQWFDYKISSEELKAFADAKHIDIRKKIKDIPMSQKFYMVGLQKRRAVMGMDRLADSVLASVFLLVIIPLKNDYRMSNENIYKLFDWMAYYIDSYFRKYTSDDGIVEAFKISEGIDIITGEKISEEERMALY